MLYLQFFRLINRSGGGRLRCEGPTGTPATLSGLASQQWKVLRYCVEDNSIVGANGNLSASNYVWSIFHYCFLIDNFGSAGRYLGHPFQHYASVCFSGILPFWHDRRLGHFDSCRAHKRWATQMDGSS